MKNCGMVTNCEVTTKEVKDSNLVTLMQTMGMLKWTYNYACREYAPRTVVLQKGRSGFGFVLRGAKGEYNLHSITVFCCQDIAVLFINELKFMHRSHSFTLHISRLQLFSVNEASK